jgi:hypothetical protein
MKFADDDVMTRVTNLQLRSGDDCSGSKRLGAGAGWRVDGAYCGFDLRGDEAMRGG